MRNSRLGEAEAGIKIARRNINNLIYPDDPTLIAESEEELKSPWWKWKRRVKTLAWNSALKKWRAWHPVPLLHGKQMGKQWKQWQTFFTWAPKSLWTVTAAMKLKDTGSLKKSYDKPRQCIKKQRHHFANKAPYSQSYGFSSSHVWMWVGP